MSSTILSLFVAFYKKHFTFLAKAIDTYCQPAVLAHSKALYEPDQALPSATSTDHRATFIRRSEVILIKHLGLLIGIDVLAQCVHDLVLFARGLFLLTVLLLVKVSLAVIPLSDRMRKAILAQRSPRG